MTESEERDMLVLWLIIIICIIIAVWRVASGVDDGSFE